MTKQYAAIGLLALLNCANVRAALVLSPWVGGILDCPTIVEIITLPEYCGMADGEITINATASLSPVSYALDGSPFQSSPTFTGLVSGMHYVSVSDTAGCITEDSVFIEEIPAVRILSLVPQNASCNEPNGSILVIVEQLEIMGYSLDKVNYSGSPMFSHLAPGSYTVYLKSHGVCLDSASTSIIQLGAPVFEEVLVFSADCNNENGGITVQASGGIGNLSYALTGYPADTSHTFENLISGEYLLSIGDALGCSIDTLVTVPREEGIQIESLGITPSDCGMSNGSIEVTVVGSVIEFILDGSATSMNGLFTNIAPGIHLLYMRDDMGCGRDTTVRIPAEDCNVFLPNIFSPNGDGINDFFGPVTEDASVSIQVFEIFSRWGNLVYSCNQSTGCNWDGSFRGKDVAAGVYVYQLEFSALDGEMRRQRGSVTLIR